jgi:hypothetical protein
MTAIKAKSELRTILDFSTGKCSKNRIKQALRKCPVVSLEEGNGECTLYLNEIRVGMYTVVLLLPFDSSPKWTKLRDYGDFEVKVYDSRDPKASAINLKKDPRFKNQYWVNKNFFGQLRIKHLVDIIAHCYRLNNLRAFL